MIKGEKVEAYLRDHHLSQAKFGEMIGCSGPMVFYIIRGIKQPSVAMLKRIADILECSVDELIE